MHPVSLYCHHVLIRMTNSMDFSLCGGKKKKKGLHSVCALYINLKTGYNKQGIILFSPWKANNTDSNCELLSNSLTLSPNSWHFSHNKNFNKRSVEIYVVCEFQPNSVSKRKYLRQWLFFYWRGFQKYWYMKQDWKYSAGKQPSHIRPGGLA